MSWNNIYTEQDDSEKYQRLFQTKERKKKWKTTYSIDFVGLVISADPTISIIICFRIYIYIYIVISYFDSTLTETMPDWQGLFAQCPKVQKKFKMKKQTHTTHSRGREEIDRYLTRGKTLCHLNISHKRVLERK